MTCLKKIMSKCKNDKRIYHNDKNNNLKNNKDIMMQAKDMPTKDPELTKTRIQETDIRETAITENEVHSSVAHDEIEDNTRVNKGTDTFKEGVIETEHVNKNDNPARQPDRRDQEGNAFDEGINEHTTMPEAAKSTDINDLNRYANVDNAQTRVLNPDEKDF